MVAHNPKMPANMGFPSGGEANQGWKLYLASLIMVLSAGLTVIARVVARLQSFKLKIDDYTIIASLAFSIVLSVAIQLAVVHGYGKHVRDLSKQELQTSLKFFWIAQTPYKIVVCLNKVSVILLYMRIFISKNFRRLCFGALAIVGSSGIATVFATIFQCVPIERSWNKTIPGTCIDSSMFWLANAVLNISTDVVVLALPIREVFKLQLKLQEKIMLCCVFSLGGFVTLTSILRVTAVANSVRNQQDQTWNFIQRGIWTLVEANLGIICACLVVLKQLVKRLFSTMFGTSKTGPAGSRAYGYGGSGAAGYGNEIAKRKASTFKNRENFALDDTVDEETRAHFYANAHNSNSEDAWANRETYMMTARAQQGTPDKSRKSDEKHIVSDVGMERDYSQASVESVDVVTSKPLGLGSGITKKIDVRISSQPSSSVTTQRPA